jgi:DNA invertase Pin-like site-specific DNA recombinase
MVVKCTKDRDLIPVVIYLRCSSGKQELSIAEQREIVLAYCAQKGYRVVREYVDEGKSGSKDPDKRVAFWRMVEDSKARDFKVVVCWDAARFTRYHNILKFQPKGQLLENGVVLDTTKEGLFDWNAPEGRWKDMAYCEANHTLSKTLSHDSNRGRAKILALGFWPNGVVPYGFDREYTDGKETLFKRRDERYRKPRDWHLRLVVNEAEADTVRLIFDLFVRKLWSRRSIASHLTGLGVPPPRGQHGRTDGAWDGDSVLTILEEPAYVGVATVGNGRHSREAHNRMAKAERPGACPALIEPHLWHEAREEVKRRREGKEKPQPGRAGVLSGFIKCGHCGYRLSKAAPKRYNGELVYYSCTSGTHRPHLGCQSYRVLEKDLLPRVCGWLVEAVDTEVLEALQLSPADADGRSAEEAALAGHVKGLEARVKGATESALLAPPAAREEAWAMVTRWREEAEQARQKLALVQGLRQDPEMDDFKAWWTEARDDLIRVRTAVVTEHPTSEGGIRYRVTPALIAQTDKLRGLLSRLGFELKVWWEKNENRGQREALHLVKDVQIRASVDLAAVPFVPVSGATTGRKVVEVRRVFSFPAA